MGVGDMSDAEKIFLTKQQAIDSLYRLSSKTADGDLDLEEAREFAEEVLLDLLDDEEVATVFYEVWV